MQSKASPEAKRAFVKAIIGFVNAADMTGPVYADYEQVSITKENEGGSTAVYTCRAGVRRH